MTRGPITSRDGPCGRRPVGFDAPAPKLVNRCIGANIRAARAYADINGPR
jgi:hypothetical protein